VCHPKAIRSSSLDHNPRHKPKTGEKPRRHEEQFSFYGMGVAMVMNIVKLT
jgi:hypothetical protein